MLARLRRVVDPAEEFWSGYIYSRNNPISFHDPDGMDDIYFLWNGIIATNPTGFWSFDWLFGDNYYYVSEEEYRNSNASVVEVYYEPGGLGGHFLAYIEKLDVAVEINHGSNDEGIGDEGKFSGRTIISEQYSSSGSSGAVKAEGYIFKSPFASEDSDFWKFFKTRGDKLHGAYTYVPDISKSYEFFANYGPSNIDEPYINNKSYNYHLIARNCKIYIIYGLNKGGANISGEDFLPANWSPGYNITRYRNGQKIIHQTKPTVVID
jgi:hypothetical protein